MDDKEARKTYFREKKRRWRKKPLLISPAKRTALSTKDPKERKKVSLRPIPIAKLPEYLRDSRRLYDAELAACGGRLRAFVIEEAT